MQYVIFLTNNLVCKMRYDKNNNRHSNYYIANKIWIINILIRNNIITIKKHNLLNTIKIELVRTNPLSQPVDGLKCCTPSMPYVYICLNLCTFIHLYYFCIYSSIFHVLFGYACKINSQQISVICSCI